MTTKAHVFELGGQEFKYLIHNPYDMIPTLWSLVEDQSVVYSPRLMPEELTDEWLAEELIRGYSRDRTTEAYKKSQSFREALEDVVHIDNATMIVVFNKEGYFVGKIACMIEEKSFILRAMYLYGVSDRGGATPRERISSASVIWHAVALEAIKLFDSFARILIVMPRDTVYQKLLQSKCIFIELELREGELINSPIISRNWKDFDTRVRQHMITENSEDPAIFGALFQAIDLL
jgi:hypothetical protein